jgi:basic membrane protein A
MRIRPLIALLLLLAVAEQAAAKAPVVFAAFATPLEEPWNMVIHEALEAAKRGGRIEYAWQDRLDSEPAMAGAIESRLGQVDIVVADAIDGEDSIRRLAAAHPRVAFLVGSAREPAPPNLSIFDSDLSEAAYLCGVAAGRLTKSGVIGVVAGKSDLYVHRTINAFVDGAHEVNPAAKVRVQFTESWYDPPKARATALAQIEAGADIIYAEREGAIAAAREKGVLAFGNLVDQHAEAPDTVITGPVWSMVPVIDHVVRQVAGGVVRGDSLVDFSRLGRGGVTLAPWHGWEDKLPAEVITLVREKEVALKAGQLEINPSSERPVGD